MNARSAPAEHLEQYSNGGDVTGLAASKLEGYRRNSGAMRTYNDSVSVCLVSSGLCVEVERRAEFDTQFVARHDVQGRRGKHNSYNAVSMTTSDVQIGKRTEFESWHTSAFP